MSTSSLSDIKIVTCTPTPSMQLVDGQPKCEVLLELSHPNSDRDLWLRLLHDASTLDTVRIPAAQDRTKHTVLVSAIRAEEPVTRLELYDDPAIPQHDCPIKDLKGVLS